MIAIKIVSIFPKYSALWNYGNFLTKYLSKNKKFNVEFVDLRSDKKYEGNFKRAISLMKGINIEPSDVIILVSPLLSSTLKNSNAKLKMVIAHDLYPITIGKGVSLPVKALVRNTYKKMRYADLILPVSKFCESEIIDTYGITNKLNVIHGGIDHDVFRKSKTSKQSLRNKLGLPNKTTLLHVGRDDNRKNFRFTLDILKQTNDAVLVKVGSISKSDLKYIKANNLDVIIMKDVDDKKLSEIYNASDILIFPSLYEGLGMPPIEAMACGLPVISTNNTGLSEVCIQESFTKLDTEEWKHKITNILNDSKLKNVFISKGLKQAGKFNWKIYSKEVEKLILRKLSES